MKIKLLIAIVFIMLSQMSCESDIKQESVTIFDQINNQGINKNLDGVSKDSVIIGCYPTFLEIKPLSDTNTSDSLGAYIGYPSQMNTSECGIEYFIEENSDNRLQCLFGNNPISQYSRWNYSPFQMHLSMDAFKGQGVKYIGFRCFSNSLYPNAVDYNYGWIKVELNANSNHLKVFEMAINTTKNKSILSGQIK